MKIPDDLKQEYINILNFKGKEKLYNYIVGNSIINIPNSQNLDVKLLDVSKYFFSLYRTTGDENMFKIGVIFRKAAHKLHRILVKMNLSTYNDSRFLYIVK